MGLNSAQQNIVTSIVRNPYHHHKINSLAGTGKTNTLIACVKALIREGIFTNESICIVTFTRNAADEIRSRLLKENIAISWVGTFHSLSLEWLECRISIEQGIQTLPLKFLRRMKEDSECVKGIKCVFVDEYQDINQVQDEIIRFFSRQASIIGIGDSQQRIYGFRGSESKFFDAFLPDCIEHALHTNYRCTKSILDVASAFTEFPLLPHEKTTLGNKPYIRYFPTFQKELLYITQQISFDLSKGTPPEDIAVLSRSNSPLYKLEEMLIQRQIPVTRFMKVGRVCLSTIHSSKGLEWRHVYVMGCNDNFFPSSKDPVDTEEDQRLFYVATTRAKERLVYVYSGGKEYITRYITSIHPSRLQSTDVCLQKTPFTSGLRDISSGEQKMVYVKDLLRNLELREEIPIASLFPYQVETIGEVFSPCPEIEAMELESEFSWFMEQGILYKFRKTLETEQEMIVNYFPKCQKESDLLRKCKKFNDLVSNAKGQPAVPKRFMERAEDAYVRFLEGCADINDVWYLALTSFTAMHRNRSAFFKAWMPTAMESEWERVQSMIRENIWDPKDFEFHSVWIHDNKVAENIVLHQSKESLLFFLARETLEYEDVLTILLKTRIVSYTCNIREIILFHVYQGELYTFLWNDSGASLDTFFEKEIK